MKTFDYAVIGGGSAGCILAARLSEDRDVRVLLLEAGKPDTSWTIHMPGAYGINTVKPRYNWMFESTPQRHLDGRRIFHPRGKTLGGSSSINGMAYVRGHALDYERWAEQGAEGWAYANVLPYFRRNETFAGGSDAYRGGEGPLGTILHEDRSPLAAAFLEAGRQAGYPVVHDTNAFQQEGFGYFSMTIVKGERASTSAAYLRPALQRPNLTVVTDALVANLVMRGQRCVGVRFMREGRTIEAHVGREVILSAGAVGTPHIMLLSGIGPADHLKDHGIAVVHDLPGVGQNLQDHLEVHMQWLCTAPVTLDRYARAPLKWLEGMRWFATRGGLLATNAVTVGAFLRSRAGVRHPDVQIHFFPLYLDDWVPTGRKQGFCVCIGTLRAESRGSITLASDDPREPPRIDPNYLDTEQDRIDLRACVPLAREIVGQPAFDGLRGAEEDPGAPARTDDEIDAYVRRAAASAYHLAGTCRMGVDEMAVVDSQGAVHGLEGLRVVDASLMPTLTSGNLNAPVMMMAEKIADVVRGRAPLAPSNVPYHVAASWATSQR